MSIKIIKEREKKTEISYSREFHWKNDPNAGFTFPCNEKGKLLPGLSDAALKNYERALKDPNIVDDGIVKSEFSYIEPAIGKCSCGCENRMEDQTNGLAAFQCDGCGQWYNLSGQELKPIERWNDFGELDDER